ncbi:MAG TPA: hypothetical protein VG734_18615 [Lacunisphaera sp.]|nr:hypothetical protein [Lacunisphaera sp.]
MKKLPLFLALSLAANAAFLVTFFVRPAPAGGSSAASSAASVASANPAPAGAGELTATQLAALTSGDLAQMKAARIPDDIARQLVIARAYAKLMARQRAFYRPPETSGAYWANPISAYRNRTKEERAEMLKAQREFSEALRGSEADFMDRGGSRFDYLPATKRDQISRIIQDYDEMRNEINSDMFSGIQLPSDREKLKLLRQEQERDIADALTPAEFEQYLLHSSQTANNVRNRYGDAIRTEDDYKKIFALQKAYDDQYSNQELFPFGGGTPSQELMAARRNAEIKLQADIQAAIGEEGYAALQRAADQEYRALTSVAKRLNLPATTADTVYAARDTYAAQSQQINQDASLSSQDRRAQLKALGDRARTELASSLGAEGAEAYAQRANWLNMLRSGTAFSTNPKDVPAGRTSMGTTVYPVPPPRNSAPGTLTPVRE